MRRTLFTLAAGVSAVLCAVVLVMWGSLPNDDSLPFGRVAAVLAIMPALWLVIGARKDSEELRRIDHGLCRGCGYDLRESSGVCPECGRPFKPHEKVRLRMTTPEQPADRR